METGLLEQAQECDEDYDGIADDVITEYVFWPAETASWHQQQMIHSGYWIQHEISE